VTDIETPTKTSRGLRLAVASAATAVGLAALLAGAAFGLQAVTLPRPSPGQLLASRTMDWITSHHAVKSLALIDGRPVASVCVNAELRPRPDDGEAASLLISGRVRLVQTKIASYRLDSKLHEQDGPLPSIRTVLGGCPRALGRRIGRFLNDRAPVDVSHIFYRGRPMLRFFLHHGRTYLVVIVDPETYAPVAVRIPREGTGWAQLAPATPRDLPRAVLRQARRARVIVKEIA
jgi:hypothetical protein